MTKEIIQPNDFFESEKLAIDSLKASYAQNHELKSQLRKWTSNSLATSRNKVVTLRSGDVLSVLEHLSNGGFVVDYQGKDEDTFMSKEPGWFYTTPIYDHPFFTSLADLTVSSQPDDFLRAFYDSTDYAKQHAFAAAFMRLTKPYLVDDWSDRIRPAVLNLEDKDEETDTPLIVENFLSGVQQAFKMITENNESIRHYLLKPSTSQGAYLNTLKDVLKHDNDSDLVFNALKEIYNSRGGVIIGFNQNVIQGEFLYDRGNRNRYLGVLHSAPELAIKPDQGIVMIENAIVSLEPRGDFETEVIKEILW